MTDVPSDNPSPAPDPKPEPSAAEKRAFAPPPPLPKLGSRDRDNAANQGIKLDISKKWVPQQPKKSNRLVWGLVVVATALVIALSFVSAQMVMPNVEVGPVNLGPEFRHKEDNFLIKPPFNWTLRDRQADISLYMIGPGEKGFPPLIRVALEIAPGRLESFVRDHKARVEFQDKTVQWISEEEDVIDGCPTTRLEYDCELDLDDNKGKVMVRTMQYILCDKPRFYKITCSVAKDKYSEYLPKFEASARSFQRTATNAAPPKIIMP